MYHPSILLTKRCNYDCVFCGRHDPQATAFASVEDVLRQAVDLAAKGARTLTLTGGEPTLHPEFPRLLAELRDATGLPLRVETNGSALRSPEVLLGLRERGLAGFDLMVPTLLAGQSQAVTGRTGTAAVALDALRAAAAAGLPVRVVLPLGAWRLPTLSHELRALVPHAPSIEQVIFRLLREDWAPRASAEKLPGTAPVAAALGRALPVLREAGISFRLADGDSLPYCQASGLEAYPELFALPPVTVTPYDTSEPPPLPEPCSACAIASYCAGIPARLVGTPRAADYQALTEAELPRWTDTLEVLTTPQHGLYDLYATSETAAKSTGMYVLRLTPRCNIKCQHCWWTDWGRPDTTYDLARRNVQRAIERGADYIAISGGEPTLMPYLPELIGYIRSFGPDILIELQTNAMRCAIPRYAQALAENGLDTAFSTFLGSSAEIYDEISMVPGTWEKALRGIHNLVDNGVLVVLNYVINTLNYRDLPAYVRWFHREFPRSNRVNPVSLNLCAAQPINTDLVGMSHLFAPYPDLQPYLREALEFCWEHEIVVYGLNSISGVPHCVLDGDPRFFDPGERQFSHDASEIFTYIAACGDCALREVSCQGIRKNYLKLHGPSGFRPIRAEELARHPSDAQMWFLSRPGRPVKG